MDDFSLYGEVGGCNVDLDSPVKPVFSHAEKRSGMSGTDVPQAPFSKNSGGIFGEAKNRPLRDYQIDGINRLRQSLKSGKKRPVLMAATGSGKTRLSVGIVKMAREKGKSVCFTVPAISLINQTVAAFELDGIPSMDIGVIQAQHERTNSACPVQVASVQTLQNRGFPNTDLVICDEAHRRSATIERWMTESPALPFIGLSATPWAKGMGKWWDDLIIAATTAGLIERGYLSAFRVFAPAHPDLSGVKTVSGDYHEGQLSEAMDQQPLIADIVKTWLDRGEGRPTLCFCVDRAHAKHIQERFLAAGVQAGYIDCYTDVFDREIIGRKFHEGKIKVVCNVGTMTTGIDWDVRCIILARPTKSEMLFVQIIGRGLRTADEKKDCIILDHSDNHTRLGFVTDIHHEHLDDGKQEVNGKKKPPLPKECPECSYLRPPRETICPNCGHKAPPPVCATENTAGNLAEMTPGRTRKSPKGVVAPKDHVWVGDGWLHMRDFYGQLAEYAAEMGYKEGFVAHKFRSLAGVWPDRWKAERKTVSWQVRNWLKREQIKWAKSHA